MTALGLKDSEIQSKEIKFVKPIIGFEKNRVFTLSEVKPQSPFLWLKSADDPELCFVAVVVFDFVSDYELKLSRDDEEIFGFKDGGCIVLSLVTIPENPADMTINLAAPIIINRRTKLAGQVLNMKEGYGLREYLLKRESRDADSDKKKGRENNTGR